MLLRIIVNVGRISHGADMVGRVMMAAARDQEACAPPTTARAWSSRWCRGGTWCCCE